MLVDGPWNLRYPLHHGAKAGILDEVRKYIEVKNFAADDADGEFLRTPLQFAVMYRHIEIVEYLLRRLDVHVAKATSELWTPLMMAVREGDFDIAQFILEGPKKADVVINSENHLGHTALHIAILFCPERTRLSIVQLLLYHGADPNQKDSFGRSALRAAAATSQHALCNNLAAKTPIPVPPRQIPSRLVAGLSAAATPTEAYGTYLVPNKWVFSGDGTEGDTRPPIAASRTYE
jgi:ankyrin repeat protein